MRSIPVATWFRFRRALENTPTVMVVLERASLAIEMKQERAVWSGAEGCSRLLHGLRIGVIPRKPMRPEVARFDAQAVG